MVFYRRGLYDLDRCVVVLEEDILILEKCTLGANGASLCLHEEEGEVDMFT